MKQMRTNPIPVGRDGCSVAFVLCVIAACVSADEPTSLHRMGDGRFPQAFVWWTTANGVVTRAESESEADHILSQLDGVASPCLHLDYFAGFKRRHPNQFVFLFCQGHDYSEKPTVFDPVDRSTFYPGHWVHCEAATIAGDIASQSGETDLTVDDVGKFRMTDSKGARRPDDICLVGLGDDGRPDWTHCEQVRLVSIDKARNVIHVRRGCYGTRPLAFKGRKAFAAPHAAEPWGYEGGVSWVINYSSKCPTDEKGRSASDALFDVIAPMFKRGGAAANFDGLEFDVSPFRPTGQCVGGRPVDTDGDLRGDGGTAGGINLWGIGYYDFCARVRQTLGRNRWFMADGSCGAGHQRNFGILNGIESEWWPQWGDNEITNWSSGFNAHEYWKEHCHTPAMNYFVHKIGGHDREKFVGAPWSHHRLVFAAAQFLDAAVTSFYTPEPEAGQPFGMFDELVGGRLRRTGWMGRPLGPHQRLALATPNLLAGASTTDYLRGQDAVFEESGEQVIVKSTNGSAKVLRFRVEDIPCRAGDDLLVRMTMSAFPRPGWPEAIPRRLTVQPTDGQHPPLATFVGGRPFTATFYFRNMPRERTSLALEIEGGQELTLHKVEVYTHADAGYRLFENGIVLANPSDNSYTFDLTGIRPHREYVRLVGSSRQDPTTNDGRRVGDAVTLGPRDGLFLHLATADMPASNRGQVAPKTGSGETERNPTEW